jgi:hypothetical protein
MYTQRAAWSDTISWRTCPLCWRAIAAGAWGFWRAWPWRAESRLGERVCAAGGSRPRPSTPTGFPKCRSPRRRCPCGCWSCCQLCFPRGCPAGWASSWSLRRGAGVSHGHPDYCPATATPPWMSVNISFLHLGALRIPGSMALSYHTAPKQRQLDLHARGDPGLTPLKVSDWKNTPSLETVLSPVWPDTAQAAGS